VQLTIYQVDALLINYSRVILQLLIPLEKWLDRDMMQRIAMENNLAETAFFVPSSQEGIDFELQVVYTRIEINLCGHAT
jgi:PhzF family phenazine biosynthesis protein